MKRDSLSIPKIFIMCTFRDQADYCSIVTMKYSIVSYYQIFFKHHHGPWYKTTNEHTIRQNCCAVLRCAISSYTRMYVYHFKKAFRDCGRYCWAAPFVYPLHVADHSVCSQFALWTFNRHEKVLSNKNIYLHLVL